MSANTAEVVRNTLQQLEELSFNHQTRGSDWIFHQVLSLDLHIGTYRPLKGSKYLPLPSWIQDKKVKNGCV
jgi:hypothetical protein